MAKLVDCPSCGLLLPAGQRCCPHCHCRYSPWRRFVLLATAALGLAGCDDTAGIHHYGPGPIIDAGVPDLGSPADLSHGSED
jgi:hypothetical protein